MTSLRVRVTGRDHRLPTLDGFATEIVACTPAGTGTPSTAAVPTAGPPAGTRKARRL